MTVYGTRVMAQLPGGQRSALIARARLIGKNMDGQAFVMSRIDWRSRRSPINRGQPACVAVGQHVYRCAFFGCGNFLNDWQPIAADSLVDRDVLIGDLACSP
jgi:hypothetical protein